MGAGWARQGLLETGLAAEGLWMGWIGGKSRFKVAWDVKAVFMVGLELIGRGMDALDMAMAETQVDWTERVGG